jgi:anti-anti-sigma factor
VSWLETELRKVIAAAPKVVDVDLAGTSFLSSTGIGVLVWLRNAVAAAGGATRIVAIQRTVLGTLRYARMTVLFHITPDTPVVEPR